MVAVLFMILGGPHRPPAWFDTLLAGYSLAYDEKHNVVAIQDPNSHFFLIRDVVCDGADVDLLLTRDRNEVAAMGYEVPNFTPKSGNNGSQAILVKRLPTLSTGKGIRIGDSPNAVRRRLGPPSMIDNTGSRNQFLEYVFKWNGRDATYENHYTFKAGKLIEVLFSRESGADAG